MNPPNSPLFSWDAYFTSFLHDFSGNSKLVFKPSTVSKSKKPDGDQGHKTFFFFQKFKLKLILFFYLSYFLLSAILGAARTWKQKIPVICFSVWFGSLLLICAYEYCQQFYAIYKSEFTLSMTMRLLYAPLANIILLFLYWLIGLMHENPMGTSMHKIIDPSPFV